MALLWIEGFGSFGTTTGAAPSPTGIVARKYGAVGQEANFTVETGRLGGYGLKFDAYSTYIKSPVLTTNATLVVGMAVKFTNMVDATFLSFYDGATQGMNLRTTAAGELAIYRGTNLLATTSLLGLQAGAWYYITLKVLCAASTAGTYAVWVGETSVLSSEGANTKAGTHDYHDSFLLGQGLTMLNPTFDDLYCLDGSGTVNNDILGNMRVATIRPDEAGDAAQFTPDSGDNYARVNEAVCGDDNNYVQHSTPGTSDLYNYGAVSGVTANIAGVMVVTDCRETDASSFSLITSCQSGEAAVSDDTPQAIGTTSYVARRRVMETDPNTSPASAWTADSLNAAQFGVKVG